MHSRPDIGVIVNSTSHDEHLPKRPPIFITVICSIIIKDANWEHSNRNFNWNLHFYRSLFSHWKISLSFEDRAHDSNVSYSVTRIHSCSGIKMMYSLPTMASRSSNSATVFVVSRFPKRSQVKTFAKFILTQNHTQTHLYVFCMFQVTREFIHAPEQIIWDPLWRPANSLCPAIIGACESKIWRNET